MTSEYPLVQSAWALLLSCYSGQACVAFGATTAGRPAELPGVEQLVGVFINTLPVVVEIRAEQRVGDWLRELQAQNISPIGKHATYYPEILKQVMAAGHSIGSHTWSHAALVNKKLTEAAAQG